MRGRRCHHAVHLHQTSAQVFALWRRERNLGQCARYLVLGSHDGLFKWVVRVDSSNVANLGSIPQLLSQ